MATPHDSHSGDNHLPSESNPTSLQEESSAETPVNGSVAPSPQDDEKAASSEPAVEAPAKPSANTASAIPNGGLNAWLQVLGGFMLFFNTWGLLNTFGIFQTYYESGALFQESSSNIAWIGSIQAFFVLVVGFATGPLYDRGHLRALLIVGSFLIVFGHMMLSISSTFWQALLSQGFCVGLGAGCLFIPAVAILPTYFSTKIGLAVGIAASGSSLGGIIYPIVFYRLIDQIGFGWTVRVLGFMILGLQLVPIFLLKMRVKPARVRALIDWSAFTDVPYMTFVLATFIGFLGLYVTLFYVSYYGQATGLTDVNLSFYLIPILNAGSVFGRTLPNAISDKVGPLNMIGPGAIVVGVLIFCMLAVSNSAGIIVVTCFFGFFSGVFIALPPVCFFALTKDKTKVGTRVGMGFGMIGFAVLAAAPGGGHILGTNAADLNWTGLWVFGGVSSLVSGAIMIVLRMVRTKGKLVMKI